MSCASKGRWGKATGRGSQVTGHGSGGVARGAIGLVIAALLFLACGDGAGRSTPTLQRTALTSPVARTPVDSDPSVTVADAVVACRKRDAGRLRSLVGAEVSDQEIEALFALGNDVLLKGQTPSVAGDEASVTVYLEVQRDSGTEPVQRTWTLARGADGLWRFTALPDCY